VPAHYFLAVSAAAMFLKSFLSDFSKTASDLDLLSEAIRDWKSLLGGAGSRVLGAHRALVPEYT